MKRGPKSPGQERADRLRDAEKDLVFACAALHEGKVVSAAINCAVAMVRITGAMINSELDEMITTVEAYVKSRQVDGE